MTEEIQTQATEMEATDNTGAQGTVDADSVAELERLRKALAETNRENAKRRKQLEAYEQAEAQRKQALRVLRDAVGDQLLGCRMFQRFVSIMSQYFLYFSPV